MVKYIKNLKNSFSDLKLIFFLLLVNFIPLIGGFIYSGYLLVNTRLKKWNMTEKKLPRLENFENLLVYGLKYFVISFTLAFPVILFIGYIILSGDILSALNFIEDNLWIMILLLVYLTLILYFSPMMVLEFFKNDSIKKAFTKLAIKKTLTKKYFVNYLIINGFAFSLLIVPYLLLSFINFLPLLSILFSIVLVFVGCGVSMFVWKSYGDLYKEIK